MREYTLNLRNPEIDPKVGKVPLPGKFNKKKKKIKNKWKDRRLKKG